MCKLTKKSIYKISPRSLLRISFLFILFFSFGTYSVSATTRRPVDSSSIASLFNSRSKEVIHYQENRYQQEKQLPTNLFWENAKTYDIKNWSSVLQWLSTTKNLLNAHYANCSLSNEEISSVLFFVNKDFAKELRNQMAYDKLPTRKSYQTACEKLTSCIEGKWDKNLNMKCETIVNDSYIQGLESKKRELMVEEANLGKDKYQNANTEDSAYDIMYDISQVGRILFQDTKVATETLFYRLPSFKTGNQGISTPSSNGSRNQGTSRSSSSNSTVASSQSEVNQKPPEKDQNLSQASDVKPISEDPEITAFIKANDPIKTETSEGNIAFVNYCMIPSNSPILDDFVSQLENQAGNNPTDLPEEKIDEFIDAIQNQNQNLEETTDESVPAGSIGSSSNTTLSVDSNVLEDVKKQLETCVKKCENLRFDERSICKLQCLCVEYVSPALPKNTTFHFLEEWALKARICTIPSKVTQVQTITKNLFSIEEVLAEVQKVIDALFESGELTTKTRTKEFLDTSLSKFNFSENVSFSVWLSKKEPTTKVNKKQLKKTEEDLLKQLKESNIDSDHERNRYILLGNYTKDKQSRSTTVEKNLPEQSSSPLTTETLFLNHKTATFNDLMSSFFDKNLTLLTTLDEHLQLITEALDALYQKK